MMWILGVAVEAQVQRNPGFSFLGAGYDTLLGNPLDTSGAGDPGYRGQLFDFTFDEGRVSDDGMYPVADKTVQRVVHTCSSETQVNQFNSAFSYYNLQQTSFDISGGFKGVMFNFGIDARNIKNSTDQRNETYANLEATCSRYSLIMNRFDMPAVSSDWEAAVDFLPLDYDEEAYHAVLDFFGTHFIQGMNLGGRWGRRLSFTSRNYQSLLDDRVDINFGISAAIAKAPEVGFNLTNTQEENTSFKIMEATSSIASYSIGGSYDQDPTVWMENVAQNPLPVRLMLTQVSELINPRTMLTADNEMVYKLFPEAGRISMDDAIMFCRDQGAEIAQVCSAEDQEKLFQATKHADGNFEPWIGAIRHGEDFDFGEGCNYRNFADDEPNNSDDRGEDCVHLRLDGTWNDVYCGSEFDVVCMAGTLDFKKANYERAVDGYCEYLKARTPGTSCSAPQPKPFPTPKELTNEIRRVCIKNKGGYAVKWTARREDLNGHLIVTGATSGTYPNPKERCLDGSQSGYQNGELMGARACAIAGRCTEIKEKYQYNERSFLQANYECRGSTLSIHCDFVGLATVGQSGQGGRSIEERLQARLLDIFEEEF